MADAYSRSNVEQQRMSRSGAGGTDRSNAKYRDKGNFDTPRNPRFNQNHLKCARLVNIVLVICNVIINLFVLGQNISNPLYGLAFYSLWGSTLAFAAHIFSLKAMSSDGWFKWAYITTEISFACNTTVVIIFWIILWPVIQQYKDFVDANTFVFLQWYMALVHAIPWITTVIDLYLTDMALEKQHSWIAFVTMCPCYMTANWIAAMTVGAPGPPGQPNTIGKIYGPEMWDSNIPLTIFYFLLLALAQSIIFYATAAIIDCAWPKRSNEIYEANKHLLETDQNTNKSDQA